MESTDILTILGLPVYEHGMSSHLLRCDFCHQHFVFFHIQMLHVSLDSYIRFFSFSRDIVDDTVANFISLILCGTMIDCVLILHPAIWVNLLIIAFFFFFFCIFHGIFCMDSCINCRKGQFYSFLFDLLPFNSFS